MTSRFGFYKKFFLDFFLILILSSLAVAISYKNASLIIPKTQDYANAWFEADVDRVFNDMTSRGSNHYRTKVHPLFPILTIPPNFIFRELTGLDRLSSVIFFNSVVAFLWIASFFVLLRAIGCRRLDAFLYSLVALVSASFIFFSAVCEVYLLGSLTMLIALVLVAASQSREFSPMSYTLVSSLTMSITITNWMVGIFATFATFNWKKSLQITINAFFIVTILWGVEKFIFPSAQFFLGDREEIHYINLFHQYKGETDWSLGFVHCVTSFFFHSIVMPSISIIDKFNDPQFPIMTTQSSLPGSATIFGTIGVIIWGLLLCLGSWNLFKTRDQFKFRLVLGLSILGQLLLHSVYGDETFLYSLHFAPLLILLVALSSLSRARFVALFLSFLLVITVAINNYHQFKYADDFFLDHGSQRDIVKAQMNQRPNQPWPRGDGHVVLSWPGIEEKFKSYLEPGGSFSPTVGSFGISVWVLDRNGTLNATSDNLPMEKINQKFINKNDLDLPLIETETDQYKLTWASPSPGTWEMNVFPKIGDERIILAFRSVGPAGGPITSLVSKGASLLINNRWEIIVKGTQPHFFLGEEGNKDWIHEKTNIADWKGQSGWGYARLELVDNHPFQIFILDKEYKQNVINLGREVSKLKVNLPQSKFLDSLAAQSDHLLMSLVDHETRPGEPINYPLPWLRDGAYVVVGLAHAGYIDTALMLSKFFAEKDFFGGFGAEADGPGLAIWALDEVSKQLNNHDYDLYIWPHVVRKVNLILQMASTKKNLYKNVDGPILKDMMDKQYSEVTLVAEASRNGFIVGKMNNHRSLLFVNAVSYLGLVRAASLAKKLDHIEEERLWTEQANSLQKLWKEEFKTKESENERTYICGLWPTWVASICREEFFEKLKARWIEQRDASGSYLNRPLWTYFSIAEAHQWLYLGKTDKVWQTLNWFWSNQVSPGLFTWWEGDGEENSSGLWNSIRGWIKPKYVTPHYWTAAEMLLLQLDMLAHMDYSTKEPVLVIGAGIPKDWIEEPMSVDNMVVDGNRISWNWDGKEMKVHFQDTPIKFRLGPAFLSEKIDNLP